MSGVSEPCQSRWIVVGAAWVVLLCVAISACSGVSATGSAASPVSSGSALASATATATAAGVASAPPLEATPTDSFPTPEPTPVGTPELLQTAPTIPVGPVTGIHWYQGPILGGTCEPTFDSNGFPLKACPTFHMFSWSRGYIVFAETDNMLDKGPVNSISVYSSPDGLKWSKPTKLNMTGAEDSGVRNLVEGPAGLLAVGYSTYVATCSAPDPSVHSLWLSKDGITWSQISVAAAFGTRPNTIAASSRGYIATGGWNEPELWISADARTWTQPQLPFAIYRSASIDGPVAFNSGFLVYGKVIQPGGCGGDWLSISTVWFSVDGASWSREVLPGAIAASTITTQVNAINGSTLLASETVTDTATNATSGSYWTSADGKSWQTFAPPALAGRNWALWSNGRRALITTTRPDPADPTAPGTVTWLTLGDDLTVTPLTEIGVDTGGDCVFGPTGIVCLDGDQISIGVLTA
jgi:hypothetical protein